MAHIHEKIDFTTCVFIVYKNTVLLHEHKKYHLWLPPGGHVELDEDPVQAALREVKEETGLDVELVGNAMAGAPNTSEVREILPPRFLNRHFVDQSHTHEHVDLVYFGRANTSSVTMEDDVQYRWLSQDEIEGRVIGIPGDVQTYALIALRELGQ